MAASQVRGAEPGPELLQRMMHPWFIPGLELCFPQDAQRSHIRGNISGVFDREEIMFSPWFCPKQKSGLYLH